MRNIVDSYDTDTTTSTTSTTPTTSIVQENTVTFDVYYGSANLARLIQSINKSAWPDDLLNIYNTSLRYDKNNTQILVFAQMQVKVVTPDTKHIEQLSELIYDRYPLVASSFMSWAWNTSSNPCADLRLNLSNLPLYPYPTTWYFPIEEDGVWSEWLYNSNGYINYAGYSLQAQDPSYPGVFSWSMPGNQNMSLQQANQYSYQASLYMNFTDEKINPCLLNFNISLLNDTQIRRGSNWPNTTTNGDHLSDLEKGGILGGFAILACAAVYLFCRCTRKSSVSGQDNERLLISSTPYEQDKNDVISLN